MSTEVHEVEPTLLCCLIMPHLQYLPLQALPLDFFSLHPHCNCCIFLWWALARGRWDLCRQE